AEPTTWTGSIGVIIPRYDATALSEKIGITSEPLKTGEFKDALNPFREMTESEKAVWDAIIQDAFGRFIEVIDENRTQLDHSAVEELATGQVFTANQALENGLIDEIGYEEQALEALKKRLNLERARIITYDTTPSLLELATGSVEARQPEQQWNQWLDLTTPRALYYCSWAPLPGGGY
ncbi:MAG: S49 family peptidase, partial [Planctomycetaceae bacterium]